VSAFRNGADDSIVVVGVKEGGPKRVELALPRSAADVTAWDLYLTTPLLNCVKADTLESLDGTAAFELPDEAVFTLVSKKGKP
jgi:hypothetical protein